MVPGLIVTKVGMSRVFLESGESVPVTYCRVDPNIVVRTKNKEKDGYNAVVLGTRPWVLKTRKGKEHTKFKTEKEWRVESLEGFEQGKAFTAKDFPEKGGVVMVSGISKGKGFQGVVRRHHFAGGPQTHGSHFKREPGSVGMREYPGRILRGHRMAGHMGTKHMTLSHRAVVTCDPEKGVIGIKGPLPGSRGMELFITLESTVPSAS